MPSDLQSHRRTTPLPAVSSALGIISLLALLSHLAPSTESKQDPATNAHSDQASNLHPQQRGQKQIPHQLSPAPVQLNATQQVVPNPPSDEISQLTQLAFGALTTKDYLKAEDTFLKILAIDPNNTPALFGMSAVKQIGSEDPEAAIPFLEKIIELNPQHLVALTNLANIYQQTQRLSQFEETRGIIKEQFEQAAVFERQKAQELVNKGDYQAAVAYLQSAADAAAGSQKSQALLEELGNLARASGHHEDALTYYEKAEAQCIDVSGCLNIRINTAWTLWAMGRQDDGLASMQALEQQNPSSPGIHDHVTTMQNHSTTANAAAH